MKKEETQDEAATMSVCIFFGIMACMLMLSKHHNPDGYLFVWRCWTWRGNVVDSLSVPGLWWGHAMAVATVERMTSGLSI